MLQNVQLLSLDECLAQGDFFSLHMPLTPQTKVRARRLPFNACTTRFRARASEHRTGLRWCTHTCMRVPPATMLSRIVCRTTVVCDPTINHLLLQGLFGDEVYAKIKRGARIVNVARGGVIDDAALARALDSGAVAQVRGKTQTMLSCPSCEVDVVNGLDM